ncbi:unnamed protein product [Effrenium voratum]|uniref:SET domain-containing protein n=1 Tax=Effrenium voratum TaxID=2562239 RepID=A0AA36INA7_9DINO|nr:unnamed protein product [Effrenium voratum]
MLADWQNPQGWMWDSAYGWAYDARGDVASWPNGAYEENVAWKYPQDAYQTYWQADAEMPISSQLEAKTRAFQPKRPDISLNLGFDEEVRPQLPSGLLDDEDDVTEVPAARARPEAVRPRMRHPLPPNQVQHPTLQAQFGVQAPQPGLQARAKSPPGLAPPKAPGTVQVSALAALWQPKAITLAPPVEVCPGITVGQVDVWGMTCTRAEWRIEDVREKLQASMGRPLVSPPFAARGLPNLRLMVFPDAREAAKGVRQRERKGLYATMVKKGPVHASLKLKADCLLDATVLRFHLTVGNIRCGPFTYDYAECAVHGCEDFGIDWLKEIDDVESLRVGVEILDVVDSAECPQELLLLCNGSHRSKGQIRHHLVKSITLCKVTKVTHIPSKAYARKAPDTAAKAVGWLLQLPVGAAGAWLSEALDAKLEAARRLPAELVIDGAVARVLQSGPQEERSDFDCVLNFELLDTLSVKDFLPFCTATLGALRPGGLALFVSEESEAFGTLKRAMRQLRPLATERLVARSLNERLTLHIYRKAEETAPEAEAVPAKAAKAETASERPAGWGQWQKAWVQPARPVVDLAKMLRGDAPEALPEAEEAEVEAEEWLSDALQLVLLPGRGRGLTLARPVEAGELLMVSKALFLAPADQIQPVAVSWLLEATVRQKQQFYSLFDGSNGDVLVPLDLYRPGGDAVEGLPVPERMDPERIYQILALNGLQADKLQAGKKADEHTTPVSGLWAIPSLLNHACLPSTVAVPLTKTTLAFVAARGMPAGAELTTRYCQLQLPLAQRRAELKRQKGFDCHCRRCEVESIVPDQLSRKLLEAQQRAAALDLPPTDFLTALNEVAAITRREVVACATEANQSQATQVLLASYSSVFLSRAMALEVAGADSQAAWEELRELLAQLEPCSLDHLLAAQKAAQRGACGAGAAAEAAAWLGRQAVLQARAAGCDVSAPSALSAAQQDAAMAAFQRQTEAQGPLDWQNILGLLKQHGSWAKEAARPIAGSCVTKFGACTSQASTRARSWTSPGHWCGCKATAGWWRSTCRRSFGRRMCLA